MLIASLTLTFGLAQVANARCIVDAETVDLAAAGCATWRADRDGTWTVDEVRRSTEWAPVPREGLHLGFVEGATWVRVMLAPGPKAAEEAVLAIGLPQTDVVDVWVGDAPSPLRTGDTRPRNPDFPASAQPAVAVPLVGATDLWIQVRTTSVASLRPMLFAVPQFRRRVSLLDRINTIALSAVASVTLLFGLIGVLGRDHVLLRYVLHLAVGLGYAVSITSTLGESLAPGVMPPLVLTLAAGSAAAALWYVQGLVDGSRTDRLLRWGYGGLVVGTAAVWLAPLKFGIPAGALTIVAALWLVVTALAVAAHQRRPWALGSLIAWTPMALTTVLGLLFTSGFWSFDSYLLWVRVAFVWQFVVMSLLLGQRFAETRDRELAAQVALQTAERELVRAQRTEDLGRLARGVAHDFNNVLTVIFGTLAEMRERTAQNLQAPVEEAWSAADRGANLVRQLLTYARGTPKSRECMPVDDVVSSVVELFRRTLSPSTQFVVELDATGAVVFADRSQLEQVVANLIVNGRDALEDGRGCLTVRTRRGPDHEVCVSVSDTGHGIPEGVIDSIFDPFFTTKGENGTGLGLSTAQRLVNAHDGRIVVRSTVGEGTTFDVWLPTTNARRA